MAGNAYRETVPGVDLADIQGNILRGYRMRYVRHLVLRVTDPAAARACLGAVVDGTCHTQVTSAARWTTGDRTPDDCLNVGITFAGLRALRVPGASLATFPDEFAEGMVARAAKLGDVGPSAPERWDTRLGETDRVHVILTIHATGPEHLTDATRRIPWRAGFAEIDRFDGEALGGGMVHFGYRDGIAQPRFAGVHDPHAFPDRQPLVPLGAVLLGHPTPFPGVRWRVPEPQVLGRNGSFSAFRVLAQDVVAFEDFLEATAKEHPQHLTPELVAAKLCGRWRNGVPLQQSPMGPPDAPTPGERTLDFFDYEDDGAGTVCPWGAHIRRCNPRNSRIVQRGANHTRQIVRRGVPYGPMFDPADPRDGDVPRGLLGNFLCASLAAQFEAVQADWLNLGLHDPRITGTNDVLSGTNDPSTSRFEIPVEGATSIVLGNIPSFVTTRGGAYTFLPSLSALRWIAAR